MAVLILSHDEARICGSRGKEEKNFCVLFAQNL